jgi:hypothetical protein
MTIGLGWQDAAYGEVVLTTLMCKTASAGESSEK